MEPLSAFSYVPLPESSLAFRQEVREFLQENLASTPVSQRVMTWSKANHDFSQSLAQKGWLGLTWPKSFGGQERSLLDRFVLTEELLAHGAPCGWHWIGDRQSGPLLMRYGNATQQALLPKLVNAEINFCIGMSEPNSGSDLASIQASATKVDGGWLLNGQKVWTTGGHSATHMIGVFRSDASVPKHKGISQFVIDLNGPGITRRPIVDMSGELKFSEIFFNDALVPDSSLLGEAGGGWKQVMGELVFERSGPERFMSYYFLLTQLLKSIGKAQPQNPTLQSALGKIFARLFALRSMSKHVCAALDRGENPSLQASIVKDRGAELECQIPDLIHLLGEEGLDGAIGSQASELQQSIAWMQSDQYCVPLRGGTKEILRGIVAKGMGLR